MGENTTNSYFYKPALGASGVAEKDLFDEKLDVADAHIPLSGLDADKPATCTLGQIYIATDTNIIYLCVTADTWTVINLADDSVTTSKIKDKEVTYAKVQDISATDKILGRSSAGAGVTEEIACTAAGRAILDDADAAAQRTTLDIPSLKLSDFSATTSAELAGVISDETGTGKVVFGTAPTIYNRVTTKTTLADLIADEAGTVLVSASSAYNLTMPNAVGNNGLTFNFVKTDFNYNLITLRPKYRAVIEDCEDAWDELVDVDVTSSADTADKKVGSASAKLVVAAGAAAGDILATEVVTSMDLSGDHSVRLWIKCSVGTASGDLQLLLSESANAATPAESLDIPALAADTWTEVDLTLASAAADRDAIISVGLKYVIDIGACDIRIDSVRAVKEKFNYPNDDSELKKTYARLNTGGAKVSIVSDNSNWIVTHEDMGQVPECYVYLSLTSQKDTTGQTVQFLNFDSKLYDIGDNFNNSTWVSGTATSTSAGHLVDSAGAFTSDMVDHYIKNTTDDTYTYVTAYNSATDVTVRDDIFVDTEGYEIKHSKYIIPISGKYSMITTLLFGSTTVADQRYISYIYKGSSSLLMNQAHSSAAVDINSSTAGIGSFNKNDVVTVHYYNSSSVNTIAVKGHNINKYTYFIFKLISKD